MNYQQANFVKKLILAKKPLDKVAEAFYKEYGKTQYCKGPYNKSFSKLDGDDLKITASFVLNEKL